MPGQLSSRQTILIAAQQRTADELRKLFADGTTLVAANSHEDALRRLQDDRPALVMICYHFDGARPYRLVQHIRCLPPEQRRPMVMVRLQPILAGGLSEADTREAYLALGVREFFSVPDGHAEARGEALARMRAEVFALLAGTPSAPR